MADSKISGLSAVTTIGATDELVVASSGTTKKITGANAKTDILSTAVLKSLYDANTVLAATSDDTPAAVTIGASQFVARLAAGSIKGCTVAEIITLLAAYTVGGTDVAVADGGTGSSTAGGALTNLGVSAFVQTLVDDADAATARATLGLTPFFDSTLGSAGANFDITSIPTGFKHLKLILNARGDTALAQTPVRCKLNNDGGANYDSTYYYATGTTPGSGEEFAQTSIYFADMTAASATAGRATTVIAHVADYLGTTFNKNIIVTEGTPTGTSTGINYREGFLGIWRSTAAITRITLTPVAGNFATGSRCTLYLQP